MSEEAAIKGSVRKSPSVKSAKPENGTFAMHAREHGHYILIDVRISVPAYLSIQQGHDICREIKTMIMKHDPEVDEVLIHLNPWYEKK